LVLIRGEDNMKTRHDPPLWAARRIHEQLGTRHTQGELHNAMHSALCANGALEQTWKRLQLANSRGLALAAQRLRDDLPNQVQAVVRSAADLLSTTQRHLPQQPPTLQLILAELRQLSEEFELVEVRMRERRITVRTDAIILDDRQLGRFSIELILNRLSDRIDSSAFECIALEPNAASEREDVTHPHVSDNTLCAGEATAAIASALRTGRIADAFCLINAVLHTYNPQSAYVAIDEWDGVRCPDCECSVDPQEMCYCEACQRDYCEHCIRSCDVCDETCCANCLERDPVSSRYCCRHCRHTCMSCERTVDQDSFNEETGLCPQCDQKPEQGDEHPTPDKENSDEQHCSVMATSRPSAAIA
jgi:hypothetical protein